MVNSLKIAVILISLVGTTLAHASNDGSTPGPGVFSGESGEFNLGDLYNKITNKGHLKKSNNSESVSALDPVRSTQNSIKVDSAEHYSAYKEWKVLNKKHPELYDNFDKWLEYKNFLRLKDK